MKALFFTGVASFLLTMSITAQMDVPPNGFNPRATVSEEVGITSITIEYSRPGVKGREGNIWGNLVPYGFGSYNFTTATLSSPWRAGANEATTISFEHDVKVEGEDLAAGTYALFVALENDEATLIFSSQTEAWGSFNYDEADDVLRIKVRPKSLEHSVEWLKYEFLEHRKDGCTIALQWEKLSVPFNIQVDVEHIVLARIREEFKGLKGFISANRIHASMYCFENNVHLEEALQWAQRGVTGKPFGQTAFSAYDNLANGYEKLNRHHQADSVMNEGLPIANLNEHIGYGKELLTQNRQKRSVNVLLGAKDKFGNIYAVNDALSYAYSAQGDFNNALAYARKALEQAPNEQFKMMVSRNIKRLEGQEDINE